MCIHVFHVYSEQSDFSLIVLDSEVEANVYWTSSLSECNSQTPREDLHKPTSHSSSQPEPHPQFILFVCSFLVMKTVWFSFFFFSEVTTLRNDLVRTQSVLLSIVGSVLLARGGGCLFAAKLASRRSDWFTLISFCPSRQANPIRAKTLNCCLEICLWNVNVA